MPAPQLILASASPARAQLLRQGGVAFTVKVSDVDEDAATAEQTRRLGATPSPAQTAQLLALAKARAVAQLPESAGSLVLGCDSVFEFNGTAYGKPHRPEIAATRWNAISGRSGTLHTGHALIDLRDPERAVEASALNSAVVHFGSVTEEDIAAYISTGEPLEVAGGFTIDGLGGAFIDGVEGDPHTVVGLSLTTLRSLLAQRGVSITALWANATQ